MSAKLWRGEFGVRLGWWLSTDDGDPWVVRGPSICVSSGGGPLRALQVASALGLSGDVEIEPPPPHDTVFGKPCAACAELATNYSSDNKLVF